MNLSKNVRDSGQTITDDKAITALRVQAEMLYLTKSRQALLSKMVSIFSPPVQL